MAELIQYLEFLVSLLKMNCWLAFGVRNLCCASVVHPKAKSYQTLRTGSAETKELIIRP